MNLELGELDATDGKAIILVVAEHCPPVLLRQRSIIKLLLFSNITLDRCLAAKIDVVAATTQVCCDVVCALNPGSFTAIPTGLLFFTMKNVASNPKTITEKRKKILFTRLQDFHFLKRPFLVGSF